GGTLIRRRAAPSRIGPLGGQRPAQAAKRGGKTLRRRAAPSRISPLGGQRPAQAAKRGGTSLRRRAAPSRISPLGGQRPAQRWSVGAISGFACSMVGAARSVGAVAPATRPSWPSPPVPCADRSA